MRLGDVAALVANHELRSLMPMPGTARYISVQTLDPVDKSVFLPELNGAIGGRRFGIFDRFAQLFQYLVSAKRPDAGCYDFQHGAARLCEAVFVCFTEFFSLSKDILAHFHTHIL